MVAPKVPLTIFPLCPSVPKPIKFRVNGSIQAPTAPRIIFTMIPLFDFITFSAR